MDALLHDANTWVALSFAVFMLGFVRYAVPPLVGSLDNRADTIRAELAEAVRLRETAQALLADFQQKQKEMTAEAEAMLHAAKQDATKLRDQAEADVKHMIERRMRLAHDSIARGEASALADIRAMMVDASLSHARALLSSELKAAQHQSLIDASIRDIKAALH